MRNYNYLWLILPILIILILIYIFSYRLIDHNIPSKNSLVIKIPPNDVYQDIIKNKSFKINDFKGNFILVNIWSSWCIACHTEMNILKKLKTEKKIIIIGLNYHDDPNKCLQFINKYNNIFDYIGVLTNSRQTVSWGIYAVPESFLINKEGEIIYKKLGPLTEIDLIEDIYKLIIFHALASSEKQELHDVHNKV
ncbi:redoxin family protein [Bartonella sp. DGB1]|uniref:redoxin family protein n=1 Tax=Bartonella sp. DGB1 TaxID=3239807 RepID=UPI0035269803